MAVNAGFTAATSPIEVGRSDGIGVWEAVVDCSTLTGATLAAGEYVKLFTLPAGAVILDCVSEIYTVDTGGGTYTLGATTGTDVSTGKTVAAKAINHATTQNVQLSATAATALCMAAVTDAMTTLVLRVRAVVLMGTQGMATTA